MIQDCHHNDLTAIINARLQERYERKARNKRRYLRSYRRRACRTALNPPQRGMQS
jgi:hypothetical protein